jgi:hypothetical protein
MLTIHDVHTSQRLGLNHNACTVLGVPTANTLYRSVGQHIIVEQVRRMLTSHKITITLIAALAPCPLGVARIGYPYSVHRGYFCYAAIPSLNESTKTNDVQARFAVIRRRQLSSRSNTSALIIRLVFGLISIRGTSH